MGAQLASPRGAAFHWAPGLLRVVSILAQACPSLPSGAAWAATGAPILQVLGPQCDSPSLWPHLEGGVLTGAGRAAQQSGLLTMVARQQGSSLDGGRHRRGAGGSPAELRRDDSPSEAQPLLARTSLHPWVSATGLGRAWVPGGWRSMARALRGSQSWVSRKLRPEQGLLGGSWDPGCPGSGVRLQASQEGWGRFVGAWLARPAGAAVPGGRTSAESRGWGRHDSWGCWPLPPECVLL